MKKDSLIPGTVVMDMKSGKVGVPYTGHVYEKHAENVAPVVYMGDDTKPNKTPSFTLTPVKDLVGHQLSPEELLTDEHLAGVCMQGSQGQCKYLTMSRAGPDQFDYSCARVLGNLNVAEQIDREAAAGKRRNNANCGGRFRQSVLDFERMLLSG
jgi:hypothetical protein